MYKNGRLLEQSPNGFGLILDKKISFHITVYFKIWKSSKSDTFKSSTLPHAYNQQSMFYCISWFVYASKWDRFR